MDIITASGCGIYFVLYSVQVLIPTTHILVSSDAQNVSSSHRYTRNPLHAFMYITKLRYPRSFARVQKAE